MGIRGDALPGYEVRPGQPDGARVERPARRAKCVARGTVEFVVTDALLTVMVCKGACLQYLTLVTSRYSADEKKPAHPERVTVDYEPSNLLTSRKTTVTKE
jgi:hypothetical protein